MFLLKFWRWQTDAVSFPVSEDTASGEKGHSEFARTVPHHSEPSTELHSRRPTEVEASRFKEEPHVISTLKDPQTNDEEFDSQRRPLDRQVRCDEASVLKVASKPLLLGDSYRFFAATRPCNAW